MTQPIGYFQIEEEGTVALVLKEFWDEHHGLDGGGIENEELVVPEGFWELGSSIYETEHTEEVTRSKLIDAGWEEKILDPSR